MSVTIEYDSKQVSFQATAKGKLIGSYPEVFLKDVKGINIGNIASTKKTLQRLFNRADNSHCPKTVVGNALVAARGLGHDIRSRRALG
ncbi:MAG: hypothetical protein AAF549_00275 [Pseudomonadota bacterium]